MSAELYLTRLWWDGHRRVGTAAAHGHRHILAAVPAALAHAIAVDYAPAVNVMQLQTRDGPMRDMEPAERAAARAFLDEMCPPAPGAAPAS